VGIEDAIHTALLTLKEGFEGQVSGSNIEVRGGGAAGRLGLPQFGRLAPPHASPNPQGA
jgi:hypothetical protein